MVWHNQAIPLPAQQANCLIGMANLGILLLITDQRSLCGVCLNGYEYCQFL